MGALDIDDDEVVDQEDGDDLEGFSTDVLDMSDDDLAEMTNEQIAEASMQTASGGQAKAGPSAESDKDKDEEDENEKDEKEDQDEEKEPEKSTKTASKDADDTDSDEDADGDDTDDDESEKDDKSEDDKSDDKKPEKDAESKDDAKIDYKQEYEKLLAPFKANGRQIQVDNVDDALTLMKMGANYNKKMAALKPGLKVVKMLDTNGLLDEEKINHLIDLSNHDAGAIAKLLKDAKVDPLDVGSTDADYKPKNHQVSDSQFGLDQVLDDLKDNESFPKTIDTISNKWDEQSKKIALNDPKIITVIDEHIQSGIYDQIVSVMESERMVGRLTDKPDLEAYMHIGQELSAQGKLVTQKSAAPQQDDKDDKKDLETAAKRKKAREAAASTTKAKSTKPNADFNPLDMSDEDFEKQSAAGVFR
jgi:hypothetical protein